MLCLTFFWTTVNEDQFCKEWKPEALWCFDRILKISACCVNFQRQNLCKSKRCPGRYNQWCAPGEPERNTAGDGRRLGHQRACVNRDTIERARETEILLVLRCRQGHMRCALPTATECGKRRCYETGRRGRRRRQFNALHAVTRDSHSSIMNRITTPQSQL